MGGAETPLTVSLPDGLSTSVGVEAADGTVVYLSVDGGADLAAQVLDTGKVRLQTVIHGAGDPHEFTYAIGNGYTPVEAADGSLWANRFDVAGQIDFYPLVADPTWEWYNAAYGAGFSKAETRNLTNLGGIAGFCGALWKFPALGAACGIAGAQWWTQAGLAVNARGCVFIAVVPAPLAVRWLSSKCR